MRRILMTSLLSVSLILFPFLQAYGEEEVPYFELDQVVVTATKTLEKLGDVGANISVVTKDEIERMHYRNIGDVLRHSLGANIIGFGYPGSLSIVSLNGTEKVIVLMDGKRMNLPQGLSYGSAGVDLVNLIGIDSVERIEVVKGPASSLYGADAEGGVVNIITRKGQENKTQFKAAAGSWGRESYRYSHEGMEGNLKWYFSANKEQLDYFKTGSGVKIGNSGYSGQAYTLRIDQELNDNDVVTYSYQHYQNDRELPGKLGKPTPNDWQSNIQNNWDITYSQIISKDNSSQLRFFQNDFYESGYYKSSDYHWDTKAKTQGIQFQLNSQLSPQHLLTSGIEWQRDKVVDNNSKGGMGTKVNNNQAFYLQDIWSISDKLSLTSGARFDHHETYGDNIMPRVLLNYKANDRTNYYTSWGEFFKAPNFNELYCIDSDGNRGNPNLKPEKGWSAELGVNHNFNNNLSGKISGFYRESKDAVKWKVVGAYYTPLNAKDQRAKGMEMQLTNRFNPYLTSSLGYSYLDVQDKEEGQDYQRDGNIPMGVWNLQVNYSKDKIDFTMVGKGIEARTNPNFTEKSYWIWDASVNVRVKQGLTAFLTVNNMFDQYYEEIDGMKEWWAAGYYPSMGRNYLFGVNVEL